MALDFVAGTAGGKNLFTFSLLKCYVTMFFAFKGFVAVFVGHPFDTIKVRNLIGL